MNIENVLLVACALVSAWIYVRRPDMQSNKTTMNAQTKKDLLYKSQQ